MTPNELLESVKSQFQVVYLDSLKLSNLLAQAIGAYQDRAGTVKKLTFAADSAEASVPTDMLEIISVSDAEGRWHEFAVVNGVVAVTERSNSVRPYSAAYFVNMRGMDFATDNLPPDSLSLLRDYLEALIAIPNTMRARQIATATGVEAEYQSDAELIARKEALELAMDDAQAIIPMATVYY